MAYKQIDGVSYEKELLDLATKLTTGRGEGKISKDEVLELMASAQDGQGVTDTELKTLNYIRENFPFTDAAASLFQEKMSGLQS